ncbi:MAG: hypothetical protein M3R23_07925 [Actinomycetota bacterium]|nr:hypothetical protein [Actinomycetota bacterium]
MADEAKPWGGCDRLASFFDCAIGDAEKGDFGALAGLCSVGAASQPRINAFSPRGAMNRTAYAASSNDRERRDVASVSVQFPFQFPHRRYQTELSQLSHCLAGLTGRSVPEGHGQGEL